MRDQNPKQLRISNRSLARLESFSRQVAALECRYEALADAVCPERTEKTTLAELIQMAVRHRVACGGANAV